MEHKNQNVRYLILGVLALVIVGVVITIITLNNDSEQEQAQSTEEQTNTESRTATTEEESTTAEESTATQGEQESTTTTDEQSESTTSNPTEETSSEQPTNSTTTTPPQPVARYTDYTQDAFNKAVQDNKNIVLFFHASWCPTCRALDQEIKNGLSRVPTNTEIFKIDFENSGGLVRQYGITTQHTTVYLKGSATSPGATYYGGDLDEVIFQIESI